MKEIYLVNIFQNIDCDASKKKSKTIKIDSTTQKFRYLISKY